MGKELWQGCCVALGHVRGDCSHLMLLRWEHIDDLWLLVYDILLLIMRLLRFFSRRCCRRHDREIIEYLGYLLNCCLVMLRWNIKQLGQQSSLWLPSRGYRPMLSRRLLFIYAESLSKRIPLLNSVTLLD